MDAAAAQQRNDIAALGRLHAGFEAVAQAGQRSPSQQVRCFSIEPPCAAVFRTDICGGGQRPAACIAPHEALPGSLQAKGCSDSSAYAWEVSGTLVLGLQYSRQAPVSQSGLHHQVYEAACSMLARRQDKSSVDFARLQPHLLPLLRKPNVTCMIEASRGKASIAVLVMASAAADLGRNLNTSKP